MKLKLLFLPCCHVDPNMKKQFGEVGFPPLGIATLTGFLKEHGIHVKQDDLDTKVFFHNERFCDSKKSIGLHHFLDEEKMNGIPEGEETLEKEGEKILKMTDFKGFDVIGFSLRSADNPSVVGVALTLAKLLKEKYSVTIIAGGSMGESTLKELLEHGFIDCAILSSQFGSVGETNLLRFCDMYEQGEDMHKIPGTIHLEGKNLMYTKRFEDYKKEEKCIFTLPDFKGLPMELYEYDVRSYLDCNEHTSKILMLPYFFVYGCPGKCAFCCYSRYPFLAAKDPEEVAKDLEILSQKYNTRYFYFLNPEINVTKKYAHAVAEELIKSNLDILWTDCATFRDMDGRLLRKLKDSGAARLVWGLESASHHLLDYIEKGITPLQAEIILKKSHKLNICNEILLICGFPYEKDSDMGFTLSFLNKNRKYIVGSALNKFWIDGLFDNKPETYGLRLRESTKTYRDWSTKPFDEVNGLNWERRAKLTRKHFKILKDDLLKLGIFGERPVHTVFHLINLLNSGVKFKLENKLGIDKDKNSYFVHIE